MNTLKDRLIETRKSKGLSQPELAKKAKVSQSAIAAIETQPGRCRYLTPPYNGLTWIVREIQAYLFYRFMSNIYPLNINI